MRLAGDELMIVFNDPLAVRRSRPARRCGWRVALRDRVWELAEGWSRLGFDLQLAAGVALGHATVGRIGFEQRWEYAPVGTVPTLAERLCEAPPPGQILISRRVLRGHRSARHHPTRRRAGPARLRAAHTGLGRPRRYRRVDPSTFFWLYSAVESQGLTPRRRLRSRRLRTRLRRSRRRHRRRAAAAVATAAAEAGQPPPLQLSLPM